MKSRKLLPYTKKANKTKTQVMKCYSQNSLSAARLRDHAGAALYWRQAHH